MSTSRSVPVSHACTDRELYDIPGEASEMPQQPTSQPGLIGSARGPGQRDVHQIPLLATTGNDLSSKESVDMPMQAFTNPQIHRVRTASSVLYTQDQLSITCCGMLVCYYSRASLEARMVALTQGLSGQQNQSLSMPLCMLCASAGRKNLLCHDPCAVLLLNNMTKHCLAEVSDCHVGSASIQRGVQAARGCNVWLLTTAAKTEGTASLQLCLLTAVLSQHITALDCQICFWAVSMVTFWDTLLCSNSCL